MCNLSAAPINPMLEQTRCGNYDVFGFVQGDAECDYFFYDGDRLVAVRVYDPEVGQEFCMEGIRGFLVPTEQACKIMNAARGD